MEFAWVNQVMIALVVGVGLILLTILTGMVGLVFGGTDPFAPTGGNP